MKYKVGDRVKYGSEICTVTKVLESQSKFKYRVQSDTWFDIVNEDEITEGLVKEEMKSEDELLDNYEELTDRAFKGGYEKCKSDIELNGFQLPEGYIFKDENGNIINATKIVLEKKKTEYPKTYEECCKILGHLNVDLCFNADYRSFDASKEQWKRLGLMNQFYQLLICRDAYWKIAGDEMGLGRPWEPDWNNISDKYCIYFVSGDIWSKECQTRQCPFAFPTLEMRDAFYENFKTEIESCKELL